MKGKNVVGNVAKAGKGAGKATLPNGEKLSDKIQQNKTKQNINNQNKSNSQNDAGKDNKKNNGNESNKNNNKENGQEGKKNSKSSIGLPDTQEMGTEAAKQALKKAAGTIPYTRWIPKGMRDKIIDKFMDSPAGQAAVEKGLKKIRLSIILALVGAVVGILMWLFLMAAVFTLIMAPVAWIGDLLNGIGDFFGSIWNLIKGDGFCPSEEKCQALAEEEYYKKLGEVIKKYNSLSCPINEDLITGTIFYGQMVDETGKYGQVSVETEEGVEEGSTGGRYFNYLDVKESGGNPNAASKIEGLAEVYANVEKDKDGKVTNCAKSRDNYKKHLIDKYIGEHYPSAVTSKRSKEDIANEILEMGGLLKEDKLTEIVNTDGLFTMFSSEESPTKTSDPKNCRCHPTDKVWKAHKGVDIGNVAYGTEIGAIADGTIESVYIASERVCASSIVKLKHTTDDGKVYYTRYLHINTSATADKLLGGFKVGQAIKKGQVIGYVGGVEWEDSCSTGPHLHFEVINSDGKHINPLKALNNIKEGKGILDSQEIIDSCQNDGVAC